MPGVDARFSSANRARVTRTVMRHGRIRCPLRGSIVSTTPLKTATSAARCRFAAIPVARHRRSYLGDRVRIEDRLDLRLWPRGFGDFVAALDISVVLGTRHDGYTSGQLSFYNDLFVDLQE